MNLCWSNIHTFGIKMDIFVYLDSRRYFYLKMTVIQIVVGAFGTVSKDSERRLEGLKIRRKIETNETTTFLYSAKWDQETRGVLVSFRIQWTTTNWSWCEKLWKSKIKVMIIMLQVVILFNYSHLIVHNFMVSSN